MYIMLELSYKGGVIIDQTNLFSFIHYCKCKLKHIERECGLNNNLNIEL